LRTLVVSDLHLGSRAQVDVLRRPDALAALVRALDGAGRLVVLGDALELRHGPPEEALAAARPVFAAVGAALGPEGEVVVVPGNHDHAIAAPWLERRAVEAGPDGLGLDQRVPGPEASPIAAAVAAAAAPARLTVAYPGLWLRDDVYAMHGQYLDLHVTVPTVERLAAGLMRRIAPPVPARGATPAHYDAVLAPLYAWLHVVARNTPPGAGRSRHTASADVWRTITGRGRRTLRARATALAFRAAVAGLRRAGLGPLDDDVSPAQLRRSGLAAMHAVTARLEIGAAHVLFGHTHRTGPLRDDDPAEWGRLVNTGCWVEEAQFTGRTGRRSPYWPGTAVVVDDDGAPPRRLALLGSEATGAS
jgi:hypothetical protein